MSRKLSNVVARLTITRADDTKVIIEVQADAKFSEFYKYYRQTGMKRSTKEFIHSKSRNDGLLHYLNPQRQTPGLEVLAERFTASQPAFYGTQTKGERNPFTSMKLRIIRKREYKKLLHAAPVGMPVVRPIFPVRNPGIGILMLLPTRRVSEQVGG